MTLQGMELLLEGLNPTKLLGLHDHRVVHVAHPVFSLSKCQLMFTISRTTTATYRHLNVGHGMVQTGTNHTNQLLTGFDDLCPCSLVVTLIPLLCAPLHLGSIVGCEGDALETMMSCNCTSVAHEDNLLDI